MAKIEKVYMHTKDHNLDTGFGVKINGFRNAIRVYKGMTSENFKQSLRDMIAWVEKWEGKE